MKAKNVRKRSTNKWGNKCRDAIFFRFVHQRANDLSSWEVP